MQLANDGASSRSSTSTAGSNTGWRGNASNTSKGQRLTKAAEVAEVAAKAKDRQLKPDDMQGGVFTVSSLGALGGRGFTPIINAPEVAILGVGRASVQPVWDGEVFRPHTLLPLALSYDHRVVDGAAGASFTSRLADVLREKENFQD